VLAKVQQSLGLLKRQGIDCEYRFTFVPGLHSVFDVRSVARQLRGAKRFVLQQFTPESGTLDAAFEKKPKASYEELLEIASQLKGIQEVRVRSEKGEEIVASDQTAEIRLKS
jgi:pyruvate formate lyase activating enzyme